MKCVLAMATAPALIERIKELHPFEVPEIIAILIIGGSQEYLNWVQETTCRKK